MIRRHAPETENGKDAALATLAVDERLLHYKKALHEQLVSNLDLSKLNTMTEKQLHEEVRAATENLCRLSPDLLSLKERDWLLKEVLDEMFGLGPLEPLMRDPAITDILINGPKTVYIEREGRLHEVPIAFNDDKHLLQIVQRIVGRVGRRVDEARPMVDARLPDGSRFNAIIPPLALDGTLVSIRRFGAHPLTSADLLSKGAITENMLKFLAACVKARMNILISGGTGSGKTTLLNVLSSYIPAHERVATIEDAAELKLQQRHVVRLETRMPNIEGSGEITSRELLRNTLRMRPDRIIIGECRGAEALDMLQAMNTGHDGGMTTIHANDTRDALGRLEMMVGMAGLELPIWIVRRQMASALQLVIQVSRLAGGKRKIVKISEITGVEGETISMHTLFGYKQTGVDADGNAQGFFFTSGIQPKCMHRLNVSGVSLPLEMFERSDEPIL